MGYKVSEFGDGRENSSKMFVDKVCDGYLENKVRRAVSSMALLGRIWGNATQFVGVSSTSNQPDRIVIEDRHNSAKTDTGNARGPPQRAQLVDQ